ncbi:MAG TPA: metalloregulator ArsR/SmtB family transcription factor [Candidatus Binatia bacterium]|jgi:ArsR family transcriptional regulator|nr:metalloregulator ArsR/SmtB family transcription factor [Candidatus Binatia bacterium]
MARAKKELSDAALQMIADRFKVLAEPMRLKLLHSLWDGELTVGEIIAATNALQANVSKHLGILQQAGLVNRRRDGLNVYYRICDETVFALCEVVCASLHDRLAAQMDEIASAVPGRKRA